MPDITKTRADLIEQVLEFLQVIGNSAPSEEDSNRVDSVIDPVCDQLSARNIYTFDDIGSPGPSGGAIEPKAFLDLARVVTAAVAPKFGMGGDASIIALASQSEGILELLAAPPRTRRELTVDAATLSYGRYVGGYRF